MKDWGQSKPERPILSLEILSQIGHPKRMKRVFFSLVVLLAPMVFEMICVVGWQTSALADASKDLPAGPECSLAPIPFTSEGPPDKPVYKAQLPHYLLEVIVPYKMEHPNKVEALWEGHLRMTNKESGAACQENQGAIDQLYGSDSKGWILDFSHSGSMTYLHFIQMNTCRTRQTVKAFTEDVKVEGSQIRIMPGCESSGPGKDDYVCSAAQVLLLDPDCVPHVQEKASFDLTQSILGVGFTGKERKVRYPKTSKAIFE